MKDVHQGLYSLSGFVPIRWHTSTIELDEHSLAQVTTFASSQLPSRGDCFYLARIDRLMSSSIGDLVRRFMPLMLEFETHLLYPVGPSTFVHFLQPALQLPASTLDALVA